MDIGYILTVIGVIFISMTLHELMHGLVAYRLGDNTAHLMGRLTLNPLKHVDPFMTIMLPLLIIITNMLTGTNSPVFGGAKPVPFNPARIEHEEWGIALMAISGPLINLMLAFVSYGVLVITAMDPSSVVGGILSTSVLVNLGFFAFNILPLPPLDGSRVMYALAPDFIRRGMDTIERYGILLVFVVVMFASTLLTTYMSGMIHGIITIFAAALGQK
jgi:Zn-dependent protease